jgi:RimJ/RimL family protein N-acetyltransferase
MPTAAGLPFHFTAPLVTERLVLRLMTPDDVDAVHAYQSREDVCRYLLYEPRTHEQVTARVAEHARADRLAVDGDHLQLALELRDSEDHRGQVIGDSYFSLSSVEHLRAEIGWTLHPDHAGRGYASEAATAVLDLAFTTIGLHRVHAELDPRNHASVAMCRRLGLREEAYFVRDMWFKGDWADTGVHAVLAEEWLARSSR